MEHGELPAPRVRSRRRVLARLQRTRLLDLPHLAWPGRLSVLAYHRIADPDLPGFVGLRGNVSATPEAFARQLDHLRGRYNVVSLDQLLDWLDRRASLPPYAALITFDDGYRDNLTHALPALRRRGLPAVLFLATGCVGRSTLSWWDRAAEAFARTTVQSADLPLLGRRAWTGPRQREAVLMAWLGAVKQHPADGIDALVGALARSLAVDPEPAGGRALHLDWDGVAELARSGVAIAAHTHDHPILARVPLATARAEILDSRRRIEAATGQPVRAFAYPNGLPGDYGPEHEALLEEAGFRAAFTLSPGPCMRAEARRRPLAIRRIAIELDDDLPRFAAKLTGLTRLAAARRRR